MRDLSAQAVKRLLGDGEEIAFLDVREHGQYGEGHPFFCVSVPYSRIEALAPRLMPRRSVRCVVMDDGDGVARRAATVLEGLGYGDVAVLTGGAPAWTEAGYTLFKGVNVPSKTFGELVEHEFETPSVSADELHALQRNGADVLVLDGRSSSEFRKMSLPTALSCPNAELGYRLPALCGEPGTTVVINCAGRTRSIIGAQTLRLLEAPNPVFALRNGTQGWRLAGYELEHGVEPAALPDTKGQGLEDGRSKADELRRTYGLRTVSNDEVQAWLADEARTTYLFDVRTAEEYRQGHARNARSAPGGQLVQATDEQLAVRNARIVLSCDNGLRSATTAIWLAGMGHTVWLLDADTDLSETGEPASETMADVSTGDVADLKKHIEAGARILDGSPGLTFRNGHIAGARWVTRARINPEDLGNPQDWVLTGSDPVLLAGIVAEFEAVTGGRPVCVVEADADDWRAIGLEVVQSPDEPSDAACIDYLFFVHDRHDGNLEAAKRYLEWELGLLAQLDEQERGVLNPLRPAP